MSGFSFWKGGDVVSKLTKQWVSVLITVVALCFALIASVATNFSYTWFASNSEVEGYGMSVSVRTDPDLIIAKFPEALQDEDTEFYVSFSDIGVRDEMLAATRDASASGSFLKYAEDPSMIDIKTGLGKNGSEISFLPVVEDQESKFYVDYTVYIASTNEAIVAKSLTVSITSPESPSVYTHNAASLDVYFESVSLEGYRGTLSVANGGEAELLGGVLDSVPGRDEGYFTVILRCYFDGALVNAENGTAYVNSATVSTEKVGLGVSITLIEE